MSAVHAVTPMDGSANTGLTLCPAVGSGAEPLPEGDAPRRGRRWNQTSAPKILLLSDVVCMTLPAAWNWTHVRGILATALISGVLFWSADLYRPRLQALVL